MESERNKQIAILVLQGMTYDNVGIKYDISRERVREITRRILSRIEPKAVDSYDIKAFRRDSARLIGEIKRSLL
jgi:DNA-directed RNA polymerase sigma subunit (sigma70/sigma32)